GPGLAEGELERVFQPFYRAEAARTLDGGGVGLGLAVARSIARAHGGDVTLRAGPEGLVARVRLPLSAG
ncbi:ATP-binding protein, partial [Phenylobacterium sp.]|uniref:ATP-binding protein n=1 Tax=Phenylobacterium sp. TaxID=1871053 RepID=UPI00272038ED